MGARSMDLAAVPLSRAGGAADLPADPIPEMAAVGLVPLQLPMPAGAPSSPIATHQPPGSAGALPCGGTTTPRTSDGSVASPGSESGTCSTMPSESRDSGTSDCSVPSGLSSLGSDTSAQARQRRKDRASSSDTRMSDSSAAEISHLRTRLEDSQAEIVILKQKSERDDDLRAENVSLKRKSERDDEVIEMFRREKMRTKWRNDKAHQRGSDDRRYIIRDDGTQAPLIPVRIHRRQAPTTKASGTSDELQPDKKRGERGYVPRMEKIQQTMDGPNEGRGPGQGGWGYRVYDKLCMYAHSVAASQAAMQHAGRNLEWDAKNRAATGKVFVLPQALSGFSFRRKLDEERVDQIRPFIQP